MGVLYTYTGIKKLPDTDGIIADVAASAMQNKRLFSATWEPDFPSANTGVLKLLWNSDRDWLGANASTRSQPGMWNSDLSPSDKAILDAIVLIRAPYA